MATTQARMYQRRRTITQWAAENPTLAAGEVGVATAVAVAGIPGIKIGDGATAWNSLNWHDSRAGVSIPAGSMNSSSAPITTNGMPRIPLPDAASTSVFIGGLGFTTWWFDRGVLIGMDWSNDHTATGNVRWTLVLRENNVGGSIQSPDVVHNETVTIASGGANGGLTTSLWNGGSAIALSPGGSGSLYSLEITRLGSDGLDTLAGSAGLCELVVLAAK